MKFPKRFALSTLLLMMLVVAAVFGYAQWRRQWLTKRIASLERHWRDEVTLSDNWLWPTVSCDFVDVFVDARLDGSFNFDGERCNREQVKVRYAKLREAFQSIGIKEVSLWLAVEMPRDINVKGPRILLTEMVDDLESLDSWNGESRPQ
jgi:hypothetical protein